MSDSPSCPCCQARALAERARDSAQALVRDYVALLGEKNAEVDRLRAELKAEQEKNKPPHDGARRAWIGRTITRPVFPFEAEEWEESSSAPPEASRKPVAESDGGEGTDLPTDAEDTARIRKLFLQKLAAECPDHPWLKKGEL